MDEVGSGTTADRNPDMSHLPKYGEGDPTLVEQAHGPAYSKLDRTTDTAKRWPELRSSQEFARQTFERAKNAPDRVPGATETTRRYVEG